MESKESAEKLAPLPQSQSDQVDIVDGYGNHSHSASLGHGHNPTHQKDVHPSNDLALHLSHEHAHDHLHHSKRASIGRAPDVVYSEGTTYEKSNVPEQDPSTAELHKRHVHGASISGPGTVNEKDIIIMADAEKGTVESGKFSSSDEEEKEKPRAKFSTFYAKYRIFFHLLIFLFFTG